jgi:hypothetical protein
MNIEERQLITHVFDQIGSVAGDHKDPDADRLIRDSVQRTPDAAYRLVQSVIVQQQEMQRLAERIRDLEWAANGARYQRDEPRFLAAPAGSAGSSVPQVEGRYAPPDSRDERPRETSPPSQGPSFLSSALTTATGVAGGMLLTDGLRKLFGSASGPTAAAAGVAGWGLPQSDLQTARADAADARRELAEDDAALDDTQDALDAQANDAVDFGEA